MNYLTIYKIISAISIIFIIGYFAYFVFASDYSGSLKLYQTDYSTINTNKYNAFGDTIGQGDGTTEINTITYGVYNNSGNSVAIDGSGSFTLVKYNTSSYKGTYPCSGTGCTTIKPVSYTCNPSNRCTGNTVTDGTDPVFITVTFQDGLTFESGKYYGIFYIASNNGNKLYPIGSSTGDTTYYEDSATYMTYHDYGDHDVYFINPPSEVKSMYFSVNGAVPDPTPSGSITIDGSDSVFNKLMLSGTGDFDLTGEGYSAHLNIYMTCENDTNSLNMTSVADIVWYAEDNVTNTGYLGGIEWLGAGYTSEDSTYSFENVLVPYAVGYNCTYPTYATIFDGSGDIVFNGISDLNNPTFEIIPPGNTSEINPPTETAENDDLITRLKNWFEALIDKYFNWSFGYNDYLSFTENYQYLYTILERKAPFGYFLTVVEQDLTTPSTTDDLTLTIPLASSSYFSQDIDIPLTTDTKVITEQVKTILKIIIWFITFVYIISRGRKIFS